MADGNDLVTGGGWVLGGGGTLIFIGKALWEKFIKKADEDAKKVEAARDAKLDSIADGVKGLEAQVSDIRHDVKAAGNRAASIEGQVSELRARIDGISAHHGPKLDSIKEDLARTDERLKALEEKRRR